MSRLPLGQLPGLKTCAAGRPTGRAPILLLCAAALAAWLPADSAKPQEPPSAAPADAVADPAVGAVIEQAPEESAPSPASPGGEEEPPLPWEGAAGSPARVRPESARQALTGIGLDDELWAALQDGAALQPAEAPVLWRLLYRLPQLSRADLEQWALPLDAAALAEAPDPARLQVFRLAGRATAVKYHELPADEVAVFEFRRYAEVTIELAGGGTAEVFARRTPEAWKAGPLDEPAECLGLFLKAGAAEDGAAPPLYFAADRVAWRPTAAGPDVPADWLPLARLGMDVGLFDEVRPLNNKGLGGADGECFYRLLEAVQQAGPADRAGAAPLDLAAVLQHPEEQHGRLLKVRGLARRITKVLIEDPEVEARLGQDHYYNVDVFVDVGDQTIRLGGDQPGEEGVVFSNRFPLTICCPTLDPETLAALEGAPADALREPVEAEAWFFKLWAVETPLVHQHDPNLKQPLPLLMGSVRRTAAPPPASNPLLGVGAGLLAILALAGLWWGVWRFGRGDRRASAGLRRVRQDDQPPKFE